MQRICNRNVTASRQLKSSTVPVRSFVSFKFIMLCSYLGVTVVNVARRAGLFAPEHDAFAFADDQADIETRWRTWAAREVRKRTAFCFILNDMSFAALFLTPPHAAAGAVSWPLPDPDVQFNAPTAFDWSIACRTTPVSATPFYELAPALFLSKGPSAFVPATRTNIGRHTLLSSIVAVVLATRSNRPGLELDLTRESAACVPLASALVSALAAVPPPTPAGAQADTFSSGVLWELAWVHLLTDLRTAEVACGREGAEASRAATESLRSWANSPRGRRAVLHCVSILRRVQETPKGREVAPHVRCFS
jgi:hypothetical protein